MENIVRYSSQELDKADVVTDSFIIAKKGQIAHNSIKRLIKKHKVELERFGKLGFKIQSNGSKSTSKTYFELNEPQASLLLMLMKNTPTVVQFKTDLIGEFFRMRSELNNRNSIRSLTKINHKGFTDAILISEENTRMHGRAFSNFERLIYKTIFGMQKKALCELRGYTYKSNIPLKSFLSEDELKKVEEYEIMVKNFLDGGMNYQQIKEILEKLGGK